MINKKQSIKKIIADLKERNLTVQLSAQLFEVFKLKTVSASVVASLIGVNPRLISKYYQMGIIERESDGNYNLIKTMNKYIDYIKEQTKKKVRKLILVMIGKSYYIIKQNKKE